MNECRKALAKIARHLSYAARSIAELETTDPVLFDRVTDELAPLFVMRELENGAEAIITMMESIETEQYMDLPNDKEH